MYVCLFNIHRNEHMLYIERKSKDMNGSQRTEKDFSSGNSLF